MSCSSNQSLSLWLWNHYSFFLLFVSSPLQLLFIILWNFKDSHLKDSLRLWGLIWYICMSGNLVCSQCTKGTFEMQYLPYENVDELIQAFLSHLFFFFFDNLWVMSWNNEISRTGISTVFNGSTNECVNEDIWLKWQLHGAFKMHL